MGSLKGNVGVLKGATMVHYGNIKGRLLKYAHLKASLFSIVGSVLHSHGSLDVRFAHYNTASVDMPWWLND